MSELLAVVAPKKFEGNTKIIQDNAIKSWGLLLGAQNICLLGDEETEANALRLGTRYARPEYSDTNVPLLDSILKIARTFESDYILFINADIVLMDDFKKAFSVLKGTSKKPFMMVGRRTNLDINAPLDFEPGWQENLSSLANKKGALAEEALIDYFLFPSNRFKEIPPLRIGRPGIDNILLYWARCKEGLDLIDITPDVLAVHQNHDYSYFPGGKLAIYSGRDKHINFELGGGNYRYLFLISECNLKLEDGALKKKHHISYYFSKRYIFDILPVAHTFFMFIIPLKGLLKRLGIASGN